MVGNTAQAASASTEPAYTMGVCEMFNGTQDGEAPWVAENLETNLNPKAKITVKVEDIRALAVQPNIKETSHELAHYPTKITREQFYSAPTAEGKALIEKDYYAECRELLLEKTGAAEVIPMHFGFRVDKVDDTPEAQYSQVQKTNVRGVANTLHCDRDPEIAKAHLRNVVGEEKFEAMMKKYKRVHIVNVWRPIGRTVERYPLMLVDTTGVPDWDYKTHCAYLEQRNSRSGYKSHQLVLKPNDQYRYKYVSAMTPEEVLIFRDCAVTGDVNGARGQPHGAFWDNNTRENAPGRESIEVRSIVMYED